MFWSNFGAPMGAPISPGVADLTIEDFEEEASNYCPLEFKPSFWCRYIDDIDEHTELLQAFSFDQPE